LTRIRELSYGLDIPDITDKESPVEPYDEDKVQPSSEGITEYLRFYSLEETRRRDLMKKKGISVLPGGVSNSGKPGHPGRGGVVRNEPTKRLGELISFKPKDTA
jgi:hypothetical protein